MRHVVFGLLSFLTVFLLPTAGSSADCVNYGAYMHWVGRADTPGDAVDVVVSGTTAYVADGPEGLRVFDVADPTTPRFLGKLEPPGTIKKVAVSGTLVYSAAYNFGLQVLDMSDPAHGSKLGDLILSGYATGVAVSGSMAYVTTVHEGGFKVIDVSDPSALAEVGSLSLEAAYDVAVVGSLAYVAAGGSGLLVVDVSDPSNPAMIGHIDTPGTAFNVVASGNLAYVADRASGLQIIHIQDPTAPEILSNLVLPQPVMDVALVGSTALVANGVVGVKAVDVSNPRHPIVAGTVVPYKAWGYVVPTASCVGIAASRSVAYVAADHGGLQMIDVGNPLSPPVMGSAGPFGRTRSVAVLGSTVCVADWDQGIHVMHVTESGATETLATLKTPGASNDVVLSGSLAFVADGNSGLQILDMSNPANPVIVGGVATPGSAFAVAVSESLAFVVEWGAIGLQIVDVSDPRDPVIVGSVEILDYAWDVAVSGSLVCVATPYLGGLVIDVSDPTTPEIVSRIKNPRGQTHCVAMSDATVYLSDHWSPAVRMYDLSDPAHPAVLGGTLVALAPEEIAVSGSMVYVADGLAGLLAIDMSDPAAPAILGNADTQAFAHGVAISGGMACVVNENSLIVLPVQCTEPQVGLLHFSAFPEPGGVVLEWKTTAEVGLLGFHVERSGDLGHSYQGLTREPILPRAGAYVYLDGGAVPGVLYHYRVKALEHLRGVEFFGPVTAQVEPEEPEEPGIPLSTLGPAFPNPAPGGGSTIPFSLGRTGLVTLRILDVAGRGIRVLLEADFEAGRDYYTYWDGRDARGATVPAGIYFYRIEALGFEATRKLVRLR